MTSVLTSACPVPARAAAKPSREGAIQPRLLLVSPPPWAAARLLLLLPLPPPLLLRA